jgi:hypothetical protein
MLEKHAFRDLPFGADVPLLGYNPLFSTLHDRQLVSGALMGARMIDQPVNEQILRKAILLGVVLIALIALLGLFMVGSLSLMAAK